MIRDLSIAACLSTLLAASPALAATVTVPAKAQPESITAAMTELVTVAKGRNVGGYANTFLPVSTDWGAYSKGKHDATDWKTYAAAALPLRDDLGPEAFAVHAQNWRERGAHVLGGCCGAGPEHIARLRSIVDATPAW